MTKLAKRIVRYYEAGIWNDETVALYVEAGRISAQDYKEITGMDYPAPADGDGE